MASASVPPDFKLGYVQGQKEQRPWGSWEVISVKAQECVKRLVVKPKSAMSLQSHKLRSEEWKVLDGTLTAVLGYSLVFARPNERIHVPANTTHAILNATDKPLVLVEIQSGVCLEDDIIRYRDPHGRACVDPDPDNLDLLKALCLYDALITCLNS